MTFEEVKEIFKKSIDTTDTMNQAIENLIQSIYLKGYDAAEKNYMRIIDKIKAEILDEKEHSYADFERYKVEYLGQDWEEANDSLPQDDFRYGMERAIEIIDKYKPESEAEE